MIDVTRPLGEVWVLLSRVDGLCGRMLGRAVAKGFDDVRAWVCCLVSGTDFYVTTVLYRTIPHRESSTLSQPVDLSEVVDVLEMSCLEVYGKHAHNVYFVSSKYYKRISSTILLYDVTGVRLYVHLYHTLSRMIIICVRVMWKIDRNREERIHFHPASSMSPFISFPMVAAGGAGPHYAR